MEQTINILSLCDQIAEDIASGNQATNLIHALLTALEEDATDAAYGRAYVAYLEMDDDTACRELAKWMTALQQPLDLSGLLRERVIGLFSDTDGDFWKALSTRLEEADTAPFMVSFISGYTDLKQDRLDEALAWFESSSSQQPDFWLPAIFAGACLFDLGHAGVALNHLRSLHVGGSERAIWQQHTLMALCYRSLWEFEDEADALRTCLHIQPDAHRIRYQLSEALMLNNDLESAWTELEALDDTGWEPDMVRWRQAVVRRRQGDTQAAVACLQGLAQQEAWRLDAEQAIEALSQRSQADLGEIRTVQACITNVSFPNSLLELEERVCGNLGSTLQADAWTDIDCLKRPDPLLGLSWTAPRWLTQNDILFFYHTDSAGGRIRSIATKLRLEGAEHPRLHEVVERAETQFEQYGRSVFACARVVCRPVYLDATDGQHFKGRIFAPIADVHFFEHPVTIEEFGPVVPLSRGGTLTPVHGESFEGLKTLLRASNTLPAYLEKTRPGAEGFHNLNRSNWRQISCNPNRSFVDESQLRAYFVDHLLQDLKDPRSVVYEECHCCRGEQATGYADYMVCIDKQWVPVEAKTNTLAERDLMGQVQKYIHIDLFKPTQGKAANTEIDVTDQPFCLVVDASGLYVIRDGMFIGGEEGQPIWRRGKIGELKPSELRKNLRELIGASRG
jgi:tetratricopeptide (TPR) repeat protein